jgi:CSLREA domain-containing protein
LWGALPLAATVVAMYLAVPAVGHAATLTVTSFGDAVNGSCSPSQCTLRDAIDLSNPGDTIVLPAGTYSLSNGDLEVTHNLALTGAGANTTTLNAGGSSRVLAVTNNATATVSGVTITGGNGGGLNAGAGGGVYIDSGATLNLSESAVTGNTAPRSGGGIDLNGTLNLSESTISGNSATGSPGIGGGIDDYGAAATIVNSTIAGNNASVDGGGIFNQGPLTTSGVTIANNQAGGSAGGGVGSGGGSNWTTLNTILAYNDSNSDTDCEAAASVTEQGVNLADDASCPFDGSGDITAKDPLLSPLAANGGPTETMALKTGSPAIGAGVAGCLSSDQRGTPRPASECDLGAYQTDGTVSVQLTPTFGLVSSRPLPLGGTVITPPPPTARPALFIAPKARIALKRRTILVGCGAAAVGSCKYSGKISARIKGKLATIATLAGTVTGQQTGSLKLTLTAAGRQLKSKALKATITLTGTATGLKPAALTQQLVLTTLVAAVPKVTTGAASYLVAPSFLSGGTPGEALVSAVINPKGQATTYHFEFSPGGSNWTSVPSSDQSVGNDNLDHLVSARLSALVGGLSYRYRVVAQNPSGVAFGSVRSFVLGPPVAGAQPATGGMGVFGTGNCATIGPAVTGAQVQCNWSVASPPVQSPGGFELTTVIFTAVPPPGTAPSGSVQGPQSITWTWATPVPVQSSFVIEHPAGLVINPTLEGAGSTGIAGSPVVVAQASPALAVICTPTFPTPGGKVGCSITAKNPGVDQADYETLAVTTSSNLLQGATAAGGAPPEVEPGTGDGTSYSPTGQTMQISLRVAKTARPGSTLAVAVRATGISDTSAMPFVITATSPDLVVK